MNRPFQIGDRVIFIGPYAPNNEPGFARARNTLPIGTKGIVVPSHPSLDARFLTVEFDVAPILEPGVLVHTPGTWSVPPHKLKHDYDGGQVTSWDNVIEIWNPFKEKQRA